MEMMKWTVIKALSLIWCFIKWVREHVGNVGNVGNDHDQFVRISCYGHLRDLLEFDYGNL